MVEEYSRLGIALGLGLLVGLQRERTEARLAGFRTFPLVTVLGALCALLSEEYGVWIVAAGLAGLALVVTANNIAYARQAPPDAARRPGLTSEVAVLVMYILGAYLVVGSVAVAITVCGAVVVLLHLKPELHSFAQKVGDTDFKAIVQFTLVTLVILPVLPNRTFGPLQVLNPFKIWLMVVLMVGLSLIGYLAYKLVGSRAGAWTTATVGGIISSTATTVNIARESRLEQGSHRMGAFVIMIASAISFLRLAALIGVASPQFLPAALPPFGTLLAVLVVFGMLQLRSSRGEDTPASPQRNPTELRTPLIFAALYAVMLLAVAYASARFGSRGLYVAGAISGMTDMDAVTLSVTNLVDAGSVADTVGWRAIIVAAIANLVFKGFAVAGLGDRRLLQQVLLGFAAAALAGGAWLWLG